MERNLWTSSRLDVDCAPRHPSHTSHGIGGPILIHKVRQKSQRGRAGRWRDKGGRGEVLRRKQYPEAQSMRRCEMAAAIALWPDTRAQLISLINRGRWRDNGTDPRIAGETLKRTDQGIQRSTLWGWIKYHEKKRKRRLGERVRKKCCENGDSGERK